MMDNDVDCSNCGKENLLRYIEINNRVWQSHKPTFHCMTVGEYVIDGCEDMCIDCFKAGIIQGMFS